LSFLLRLHILWLICGTNLLDPDVGLLRTL
jgi:hypothetical protein